MGVNVNCFSDVDDYSGVSILLRGISPEEERVSHLDAVVCRTLFDQFAMDTVWL
jgi:hypothetical protein